MATYLISYDLRAPGRDYSNLYKAITAVSAAWWHGLESTWVIITDMSAVALRDALLRHVDANDKIVVFQLARAGAWKGVEGSEWLKAHL